MACLILRTLVLLVAFWLSASSAELFAAAPETAAAAPASSGIAYAVTFAADNQDTALISEMEANSQLLWLREERPDSRVALERRVAADMETARKILRSQGYYEGKATRVIEWEARPVRIRIQLDPGPRASVGRTEIIYRSARPASPDAPSFADRELFPRTLAAFGLNEGDPATAEAVLDAVERIGTHLERRGYPLARTASTEYVLIESTHSLRATVVVDPGPFMRMGQLRVQGDPNVSETYLKRLVPWRIGDPWNADSIEKYRTTLQETGLFSMITLKPDPGTSEGGTGPGGLTPVLLTVTEAPPRTVSGGVRYSTDNGFGVNASWEHRNLFGGGERLRVFLPVTEDLQMLGLSFTKPEFGRHDQNLVAEAEARNETTDAYDQTAGYAAVGLERRFGGEWRHWWASARISAEGGEINDHLKGRQTYALFGLPLGLRRDTTNDFFNPTQGTRLALSVTPYSGMYDGPLSMVRTRIDASGYLTPTGSDRLVLAARAAAGSLAGASASGTPASLRFYVGGGGSVRGYKYQSIGPRNEKGDPTGGLSFTDFSLEARFRVGDNFGIVPFLDGGMVYDKTMPDLGKNLDWGAGIGLRYYTPIGPVRLDVGVPLQDRDHQKAFQIYLSLGQAF